MSKRTLTTPIKLLEINQIVLISWAINRRANEIVEYPDDLPKKNSFSHYVKNLSPDYFVLLKRWLNKDLRWDWFMCQFDLWRCGILPYADNEFMDRQYADRLDKIEKYPKKPLFSKNTHEYR